MNRRESLKLIAIASLAAAFPGCTQEKIDDAAHRAEMSSEDGGLSERTPSQLSAAEYAMITMLVDLIIPADSRSGSASDASVPAFIDFMMEEAPEIQNPLHAGLAWINNSCEKQYGSEFVDLSQEQQTSFLDSIAYPDSASPDMKDGVTFFSTLRDLTATGFWSSKIGMTDLNYTGNTPQASWEGCSHEAMSHLGLSYDV